jgi:hypothetical protein
MEQNKRNSTLLEIMGLELKKCGPKTNNAPPMNHRVYIAGESYLCRQQLAMYVSSASSSLVRLQRIIVSGIAKIKIMEPEP